MKQAAGELAEYRRKREQEALPDVVLSWDFHRIVVFLADLQIRGVEIHRGQARAPRGSATCQMIFIGEVAMLHTVVYRARAAIFHGFARK